MIFTHFIITAIITAVIFLLYAVHSHLFTFGSKEKPAVESTFSLTTLMRLMLIPAVISVSLFMLPLALHQKAPETAAPTALQQQAEEVLSEQADLLEHTGDGSVALNTLVNIAQLFSMEITAHDVWDLYSTSSLAAPGQLQALEVFWITFVLCAAPLMTIITAASFFRLPRFWCSMLFSLPFGKPFIVFSELNERSRKYAAILKKSTHLQSGRWKWLQRPYIIFCCDENTADESVEVGQVLLMKRSITNLHILGKHRFHFYLISEDETLTVEQAENLQKKYQHLGSRIYCVSASSINEHTEHAVNAINTNLPFLPHRGNKTYAIDIIDEKMRIIYQDLYENPLLTENFLCAVDNQYRLDEKKAPEMKTIRVLILGAGLVGELVARTMMWYCQLPDYDVEITVADQKSKESLLRQIFRNGIPDEKNDLLKAIFYNRVKIRPVEKTDLSSSDLERLLDNGSHPFHAIYVCLGNDSLNYQISLRVRRYFLHHPAKWGFPDIRTVIWNDAISDLMQEQIPLAGSSITTGKEMYTDYALEIDEPLDENKRHNARCGIYLLGSMSKILVSFEELKMDALRYHTYYSNPHLTKEGQKQLFCDSGPLYDEAHVSYQQSTRSDVRSNYAVALHGKAKYIWHLKNPGHDTKLFGENEHIRWCIFKITEGNMPVQERYVPEIICRNRKGKDEDFVRGYHVCLQPWTTMNKWHEKCPSFVTDKKEYYQSLWETHEPFGDKKEQFTDFWPTFWCKQLDSDNNLANFSISLEGNAKSSVPASSEDQQETAVPSPPQA